MGPSIVDLLPGSQGINFTSETTHCNKQLQLNILDLLSDHHIRAKHLYTQLGLDPALSISLLT